jgi:hypothetical protein
MCHPTATMASVFLRIAMDGVDMAGLTTREASVKLGYKCRSVDWGQRLEAIG